MTPGSPPTVVVPIRTFAGMSRLGGVLPRESRVDLARRLAERLADAVLENSLPMIVVTSDDVVTSWAADRATVVADPGDGLDGAAAAGVSHCTGAWVLAHADLPLVDRSAMGSIVDLLAAGRPVLVPSADGGTTVIAAARPFAFSFGPGSFHRHLARAPGARILTDPRLSVDLDTPAQLHALGKHLEAE